MDYIIKDKCNDCPFYIMDYSEWAVTTEPCASRCNLMLMLNYESDILNFHEDIGETVHIPDNCPLRKESFNVKLHED